MVMGAAIYLSGGAASAQTTPTTPQTTDPATTTTTPQSGNTQSTAQPSAATPQNEMRQESGNNQEAMKPADKPQEMKTEKASGKMKSNVAKADQKFIMDAGFGGLAEVKHGKLAAQKGGSEEVKQYGQQMVDEHTKANNELATIGTMKGEYPPGALNAKHKSMQEKLEKLSGAEFDREYVKGQVKGHQEMLTVLDKEIKDGTDSELKAFAEKMKPSVQAHLTKAEGMMSAMMPSKETAAPAETSASPSNTTQPTTAAPTTNNPSASPMTNNPGQSPTANPTGQPMNSSTTTQPTTPPMR